MHETTAIRNMLDAVAGVQRENGSKPVSRIIVELSEFGGWDPEHFRQHFRESVAGTEWEPVTLELRRVPTGPEAKLVAVTLKA